MMANRRCGPGTFVVSQTSHAALPRAPAASTHGNPPNVGSVGPTGTIFTSAPANQTSRWLGQVYRMRSRTPLWETIRQPIGEWILSSMNENHIVGLANWRRARALYLPFEEVQPLSASCMQMHKYVRAWIMTMYCMEDYAACEELQYLFSKGTRRWSLYYFNIQLLTYNNSW
jgi:hypothetical protein